MLKTFHLVGVLVLSTSITNGANAQTQSIRRQVWEGTTLASQFDYASGATVTVPLTGSTTRVNLFSVGTGALADIGELSFSGTAPASLDLVIGQGALNPSSTSNLANAAQDWVGASLPSGVRLSGAIAGDLTGNINPRSIVRLEVNGVLDAAISSSVPSGAAIGLLLLGTSTTSGSVVATSGDILRIDSTDPATPVRGPIEAVAGAIGDLNFACGADIAGTGIRARDGINSIIAATDALGEYVRANITAAIDANTGDHEDDGLGGLNYVECAQLAGSVSASQLMDGFSVGITAMKCGVVSAPLLFTDTVWADIEVNSFTGQGGVTIEGGLRASIKAQGDITYVHVLGSVKGVLNDTDVVIQSETGQIGEFTSGGDLGEGGSGQRVRVVAPGRIGRVVCDNLWGEVAAGGALGEVVIFGHLTSNSGVSGTTIERFDVGTMEFESRLSITGMCCSPTALPGPRIGSMHGGISVWGAMSGYGPLTFPIIVNADLSGGTFDGQVRYGNGSISYLITSPDYTELESELGGGAVGVAPFKLKRNECIPASPCTTLPCSVCTSTPCPSNGMPILTRTQFEGESAIVLPFYGPVKANPGVGRPVLHLYKANQQGVAVGDDLGGLLEFDVAGRKVTIQGSSLIDDGRYVLVHGSADSGLLCDNLMTTDVPVTPFKYHFLIVARPAGGLDDVPCVDFDGDGDIGTDDDIEAFFACVGGTCCPTCGTADFNCDGDAGTDQDIEAFFRAVGGSPECEACNT